MTKVFVHGNPEVDAIWGPLVQQLVERGVDDVVLLSPPGFGAPTPDGWGATAAEYVGWLIGELDEIDGPIDIVGHDWGAGHVFGLLSTRPDMVRSYACDVGGLLHPDYVWHDMAQAWQTPEVGEQVIEAMTGGSVAERAANYEGLGLTSDVATTMAEALDAEMGRCILALYRDAAQPALAELGARLFAAELPSGLIVNATGDEYVATDLGAEVAKRLGASVAVLEGNGHWWMVEDPAAGANALVAFWSGM